MRIAIYTIESVNLGNRLQNYAVQEILTRMGHTTRTIHRRKYSLKARTRDKIRAYLKYDKHSNYVLFNSKIHWYNKSYISKEYFAKNICNEFDYFVIGSDQIWNPTFPFSSENDFLPFVPEEKKISLAASMGIEKVPHCYENYFSEGLKKMKAISVREAAAVDIVRMYADSDAELLIDPTLMLSQQEWKKISKKPKRINFEKEYILTYFLGDISESRSKYIQKVADDSSCKIYSINNPHDEALNQIGPSEFLYMIEHAKLVVTDSFHATIFSFIFRVPFIVFNRETNEEKMNSRMDTLLTILHLQNRRIENNSIGSIFDVDFSKGIQNIEIEKSKFIQFLNDNLK